LFLIGLYWILYCAGLISSFKIFLPFACTNLYFCSSSCLAFSDWLRPILNVFIRFPLALKFVVRYADVGARRRYADIPDTAVARNLFSAFTRLLFRLFFLWTACPSYQNLWRYAMNWFWLFHSKL
jgi:hypothetical protein